MSFWVIVIAIALNMAVGRFFRPYTGWAVSANTHISDFFGKWSVKSAKRWGTVLTVFVFLVLWIGIDALTMVLQYQSEVYAKIIYGVSAFFFIQCGQTSGAIRKFRKQTSNQDYTKQLFSNLLVEKSDRIEQSRYNKAFTLAYIELLARRVIFPLFSLIFLGAGFTAAYMLVDTFAASDRSENLSSHAFTTFAVKLADVLSWAGYAILALILKGISWVTGTSKHHEKIPMKQKCYVLITEIFRARELNDALIRLADIFIYVCFFSGAILLVASFILIQTTLAALGLDEYWDFWSGKNIIKE